jgi:hypothetical protein
MLYRLVVGLIAAVGLLLTAAPVHAPPGARAQSGKIAGL